MECTSWYHFENLLLSKTRKKGRYCGILIRRDTLQTCRFPMMAKSVKIIQQRGMDCIRELGISTDTVTSPVPVPELTNGLWSQDLSCSSSQSTLSNLPWDWLPYWYSIKRDHPACFCSPKRNPSQDSTGLVAVLYSPAGHHINDWKLNLFIDMPHIMLSMIWIQFSQPWGQH